MNALDVNHMIKHRNYGVRVLKYLLAAHISILWK